MKPTKNKYLVIAAVYWIAATITYCVVASGPATNVVTLTWIGPTNSPVPYVFEVQQSLLNTNSWTSFSPYLPSTTTNLTLSIDRDLKFWRVRALNATNNAWATDFSNVASTLWPGQGDGLSIRLGQ